MRTVNRLREQATHDADFDEQVIEPCAQHGNLLTARQAALYAGRPSVKAFYAWRDRRGVRAFGNGLYSRAALDRALAKGRKPHRMAAASLANLRQKRGVA